MDSIPNEILCIIFDAYVYTLKRSPVKLLSVCRRWHDIALSTPNLWTHVEISLDTREYLLNITANYPQEVRGRSQALLARSLSFINPKKYPQETPCLLRTYLSRSISSTGKGLPLDILVKWTEAGRDRYNDWSGLLNKLFLCLSDPLQINEIDQDDTTMRWRSFTILFPRSTPVKCYPFSHGRKHGENYYFPMLETLVIHGMATDFAGIDMPNLRTIYISGVSSVRMPPLYTIECLGVFTERRHNIYFETGSEWMTCKNVQTLHLSTAQLLIDLPTNSLPKVQTIYLHAYNENLFTPSRALSAFQSRFNEASPLPNLAIAYKSFEAVVSFIENLSGVHIKKLKLSSYRFYGRPDGMIWDWSNEEYRTQRWQPSTYAIRGKDRLLELAEQREFMIEAMDAQMEDMLYVGTRNESGS